MPTVSKPVSKALRTYIAIVLDQSGSMQSCREQTITGFNEQVQVCKRDGNEQTFVSLFRFNDNVDAKFFNVSLNQLSEITYEDYKPDGMTAMYDAVGDAITRLKNETDHTNEENAYLVVILSDGFENASKRYKQKDIAEQIQSCQATGRWTFTYLGSNQDLSKISQDLNIPTSNMASYVSNQVGTAKAMKVQGASMGKYLKARDAGKTQLCDFYSEDGKIAEIDDKPDSQKDSTEA
jgi:hypothetical protein